MNIDCIVSLNQADHYFVTVHFSAASVQLPKARLQVDIIDGLDLTFSRSTRSIDLIDFNVPYVGIGSIDLLKFDTMTHFGSLYAVERKTANFFKNPRWRTVEILKTLKSS